MYQAVLVAKSDEEVLRFRNLDFHLAFMFATGYLRWYHCYLYGDVEDLHLPPVAQLAEAHP